MTLHSPENSRTFLHNSSDPEGDTITVAELGLTSGATAVPGSWPHTISGVGPGAGCSIIVQENGSYQVDDGGSPVIAAGGSDSVIVYYKLKDNNGNVGPEYAKTISLQGNQAPTFDLGAGISVEEAAEYLLTPAGVATDPDGKAMTFASAPVATNGTINDNGDGTYDYVAPAFASFQADSISVVVEDHLGAQLSETISVTVTEAASANLAPTATTNDERTLAANEVVLIHWRELFSDPDSGPSPLSIVSTASTAGATIEDNLTGDLADFIRYTVPASGTDTISITVTDGADQVTGTIPIAVDTTDPGFTATPTLFPGDNYIVEAGAMGQDSDRWTLFFGMRPISTSQRGLILGADAEFIEFRRQGNDFYFENPNDTNTGGMAFQLADQVFAGVAVYVLASALANGDGTYREQVAWRAEGSGMWHVPRDFNSGAARLQPFPFGSTTQWSIGGQIDGGAVMHAEVHRIAFWDTVAADLTDAATRDLFMTPGGLLLPHATAEGTLGAARRIAESPVDFNAYAGRQNGDFVAA